MRIIAGSLRGRRLAEPRNMDIRPTTDRAKEGLFNIINYYIEGSDFLDLFAGACGISFEAYSRGAANITAVDMSSESKRVFMMNEEKMETGINYVSTDVFNFVERETKTYDYIFMDPPYDLELEKLQELIVKSSKLLNPDGQIIVEFPYRTKFDIPQLDLFKNKKYGKSGFFFFKEADE